ncbi:hypothetical protein [Edaphocola flava]|uniref:hypothetical protein n=1 Tax=Edaphocola flava TaxID=2499629 RepID=UPI0013871639|nr:hypothetical protein [Edaphocola flava]
MKNQIKAQIKKEKETISKIKDHLEQEKINAEKCILVSKQKIYQLGKQLERYEL